MPLSRFKVKHEQRCENCDNTIYEGDYAGYSKNEPGVVICNKCCDEEDDDGN